VPEALRPGEAPEPYLGRIVDAKLARVAACLDHEPFAAVLVADTTVVIDGKILGKPQDVADAARLVGLLVGRTHTVLTRYAISGSAAPSTPMRQRTVRSTVTMRAATPEEVMAYAATGEGLDKAGAYAVQGLGSFLVQSICGSHSNVIGLPACEVVLDLVQAGLLERFP
jgi:septum formation protein